MKFNVTDYRDRFVWMDKSHKNVQIVSDHVKTSGSYSFRHRE